jgi:GNAT superfamily N-acetyltransferase
VDVLVSRGAAENIPELRELWAALHAHHASLGSGHPVRALPDSWERRRSQYELWLAEGAVLLIARRAEEPVGYALVRLDHGPATWDFGERVAELETLSVAAGARGEGTGARLLAAARETAREWGAGRLMVGVAAANDGALRFYEREAFEPFYVLLAGSTAQPFEEPGFPPPGGG